MTRWTQNADDVQRIAKIGQQVSEALHTAMTGGTVLVRLLNGDRIAGHIVGARVDHHAGEMCNMLPPRWHGSLKLQIDEELSEIDYLDIADVSVPITR